MNTLRICGLDHILLRAKVAGGRGIATIVLVEIRRRGNSCCFSTEAGKASRIWSVDACAYPTVISPSSYRRGDLGPRASCVICERIVEILKPRQRPLWLPAQNRAEAGVSLHPTYWVGLRRQESSPAHLGGQGRAALEARIGLVSQSECFLKERNRNISSLVIF